jgi:hypothetical protein
MKQSAVVSRTPSTLSDSLRHQLNMYAVSATAASVGVLALTVPAEAKIVYTPTHQVINHMTSRLLPRPWFDPPTRPALHPSPDDARTLMPVGR